MSDKVNDFDNEYFELLSEYGKSAFNELIGDLSRQRQTNLLISAFITILLSFSIVGNVETDFFGIKFTFINIKIIPAIAGSMCLYFLSIYLVSIFQDWQHAKYNALPTRNNILNLTDRLSLMRIESVRRNLSFEQKHSLLEMKFEGVRQKYYKQIKEGLKKEYEKEIKELTEEHKELERLEWARSEIIEEIRELERSQQSEVKTNKSIVGLSGLLLTPQHIEERKSLYEKLTNFDKNNNLQVAPSQAEQHQSNSLLEKKSELIYESVRKYQTLNGINVILQIIFPSMLALIAIGSAVWKLSQ